MPVVPMFRWKVLEFFWGTAVLEERTGRCHCIFLRPDAAMIDVEALEAAGLGVILHQNGIEFIPASLAGGVHPR